MAKLQSAGILLFRLVEKEVEVLLAHPGGPFWRRKDHGSWTIPKGLIAPGEAPLTAAFREFAEETGYHPAGQPILLGNAKQPGGKIVHVWAVRDDWNPADLRSSGFEIEWPPRSGRRQVFPEIDRAAWFGVAEARNRLLNGQLVFIDRLLEKL